MKNKEDEGEIKAFTELLVGAYWRQRDQKAKVIEDWTKKYIEPGIEECKSLKTELAGMPSVELVERTPRLNNKILKLCSEYYDQNVPALCHDKNEDCMKGKFVINDFKRR